MSSKVTNLELEVVCVSEDLCVQIHVSESEFDPFLGIHKDGIGSGCLSPSPFP